MPDQKKPANGVIVVAPDGEAYVLPPEHVAEAALRGFKPAVRMASADGQSHHWVPLDQVEQGLQHGNHLLRTDGTPYAPGMEPVIVGHNSAGQPIWGNAPDSAKKEGFVGSVKNALGGAAKSVEQLLDPRPTKEEIARGLTSPYDYAFRNLERVVEGQVDEGERAAEEFKAANAETPWTSMHPSDKAKEHRMQAVGHGIAAIVPGVGPMVASAAEQAGSQVGEGDPAGAAGTLTGDALAAVAPEVGLKGLKASRAWMKGKLADIQAPQSRLNTPVSPGDLTPKERWQAANWMGVNLDRAQATNSPVPKIAKSATEHGLVGSPIYEENNAQNLTNLHEHVRNIVNDAHPQPMTKEEFGRAAADKLRVHRDSLADEPGQRAQAEALLNSADPRSMSREEFGDAASEALENHRLATDEKINALYHDLDGRLGDVHPDMKGVQEKAKAIYSQNKRFYENHPDLLKGADARAWAIIKDFAGIDDKAAAGSSAKPPVDTWADLQRARSHLLDLTRGPEFLGELSTGWIKQMTGAIDDAMTSAEKTPGLKAKDVQQFRQANSLYKGLKETYDNPQSPFYWASRQEGLKVADRLNSLGPEDARRFREVMNQVERTDLVGQQQRQFMQRLLDPAGNGTADLAGLKSRWTKLPKEQTESLLEPAHMKGLNDLAEKSATETPYDTANPNLAAVIKAGDDGTKAHQAMFEPSTGRLKLTPAEVRQLEQADPTLIPQLRRQAISNLFDPTESGTFDLKNFPSKWNRTQAAPLESLLTPEQMKDLDDVSSVSKAVNHDTNPSGSAKVGWKAAEAASIPAALMSGTTEAVLGHPVAGAITAAAPIVGLGSEYGVARRMVNPEATADLMTAPRPSVAGAVSDAFKGGLSPEVAAASATAANAGDESSAEQRWKEVNAGRPPQPSPSAPPGTVQPALQVDQLNPAAGAAVPASAPKPALKPPVPPAIKDAARLSAANAQISDALANPPAPPAATPAPDGATHEVIHPDGKTVIGHMVDGAYVPLDQ